MTPCWILFYTEKLQEAVEVEENHEKPKLSQQEIRSLWKKAILQTLLLVRMEKEKEDIKGRGLY